MPSIEQTIHDVLATDSTLAGIVGERIVPLDADQFDARPFITFKMTSDESIGTTTGASEFSNAEVEIGCFADSYAACASLAKAVKTRLDYYAGTVSGYRIAPAMLADSTDIEEVPAPGEEKPVFVKVQNYKLLYRAA